MRVKCLWLHGGLPNLNRWVRLPPSAPSPSGEMVDTLVLGTSAKACRFKSCLGYHYKQTKMKINYTSDLHLEFADVQFTNPNNAEILVLAGDVCLWRYFRRWPKTRLPEPSNTSYQEAARYRAAFKQASELYKHVIYVAGNHEYYSGVWPDYLQVAQEEFQDTNIHLLDCDVYVYKTVAFLGTTLWSPVDHMASCLMNDYKAISTNSGRLQRRHTIQANIKNIDWLKAKNSEYSQLKRVVVTHHAPSLKSCLTDPHYEPFLSAYGNDLDTWIETTNIAAWIHGHVHRLSNYQIGSCNVVANPRGYVQHPQPELIVWPLQTIEV